MNLVSIPTLMGQSGGLEPPKEARPHFNIVAIYGLYQFAYLCMCREQMAKNSSRFAPHDLPIVSLDKEIKV